MRRKLISILLLLGGLVIYAADNHKALIRELDEAIKNRPGYQQQKEDKITQFKQQLIHTTEDADRYRIYGNLFDEYRAYNTDSSLIYVQRKQHLARRMDNKEYIDDSNLNMVEVMGTTGMYMEALTLLNDIDRNILAGYLHNYYFHLRRTIYGLMGDYAVTEREKKEYYRLADLYRDSLILFSVGDPLNYTLVKSDQLIVYGKYDEAIALLDKIYAGNSLSTHARAMVAYTLAEGYHHKGMHDKEKGYLLESAIADLKSAVREYVSLRKLATLFFIEGDVDRAYLYLKCSFEDATLCNARLRTLEISQVFPIIDNAYQSKVTNQKRQMNIFLICVSILALFLMLAVFFIYRQMKKVAIARKEVIMTNEQLKLLNDELNMSNQELKELNLSLSETSHIKEEYIGRYMDQCSAYLEKMDIYRRSLGKLASAGKVDELYKTIKSNRFIESELKEFYTGFDETFLRLFPHFVENFNELLAEKIYAKPGELLNTELRIFALIRLGITDSVKIAQFLRYSVTTIYNYRTRVRNKAKEEREDFENKVMKL